MTDFITLPIEVDPAELADCAFDYLQGVIPGWSPNPGNLDVLIIEALSQIAAEQAEVDSGLPIALFRYFGPLVGAPPLEAVPAQAQATFFFAGTAGYTVLAGSAIGLRDADGTLWSFVAIADTVFAPGVGSGAVQVEAQEPGVGGNGLSGTAELIAVDPFVTSATVAVASSGGTDAEDDGVYLDRLSETLTLLSPRPILPADFALLARSVPGVFRATAIDGLKPGPPYTGTGESTGNERTITVAVASSSGAAVGSTIRAAVDALLQSEREVNFVVYVVDPIYATVDVTFTVKCWPTYDPADVETRAEATVAEWLSSARWGTDETGDPTTWLDERVVRLGELYEILNAVEGVRYVQGAPTIGLGGGGQAAADLAIGAGTAIPVLTQPGVIAGTAVA